MRWADASLRKEITGTIIASLYSISLGVGSEEVVRKSSRQTKEHRMSRHVALFLVGCVHLLPLVLLWGFG